MANSGKLPAKRSKWLTLSLGVHSTEVARVNIGRFVKTLRIDRAPLEGTSGGSGAAADNIVNSVMKLDIYAPECTGTSMYWRTTEIANLRKKKESFYECPYQLKDC